MKKDDMIEFLIENGEFTKKELKKMKVGNVEELFNERFDVIDVDDVDLNKLTLNTDQNIKEDINTEDGYINGTTEAERLGHYIKEPEVEEEIVIDLAKLSPVERRAYARTGILPKITMNRYTRFDDENPKMDD